MTLPEHVALITGASGGIGTAIAARLAREGAAVVIHYGTNVERAEQTRRIVEDLGSAARGDYPGRASIERTFPLKHLLDEKVHSLARRV